MKMSKNTFGRKIINDLRQLCNARQRKATSKQNQRPLRIWVWWDGSQDKAMWLSNETPRKDARFRDGTGYLECTIKWPKPRKAKVKRASK